MNWRTAFEASGYTIWRADPGQPFAQIATTGGTDLAYVDVSPELVPGETYR